MYPAVLLKNFILIDVNPFSSYFLRVQTSLRYKTMGEPVHYILCSWNFWTKFGLKVLFIISILDVQLAHSFDSRHRCSEWWREAKATQAKTLSGKHSRGETFIVSRDIDYPKFSSLSPPSPAKYRLLPRLDPFRFLTFVIQCHLIVPRPSLTLTTVN